MRVETVPSLLTLLLLAGVLSAPRRWSYFSLLLLGFVDASGKHFESASTFGLLNSGKIILAPIVVLLRERLRPAWAAWRNRSSRLILTSFGALALYAAVASTWSEWHVSAVKMVGYLFAYALWYVVIYYGWLEGHIDHKVIFFVLLAAIGLAVLQTYILTPTFGVSTTEDLRFTAFITPQYFAAGLVFLLAIFIFYNRIVVMSLLAIAVSSIAIILSGSRTAFIAVLWVLLIFTLHAIGRTRVSYPALGTAWAVITGALAWLTLFSFTSSGSVSILSGTRIAELQYLTNDWGRIGTLTWRLLVFKLTLQKLQESSWHELLFGHGTSSGAEIALAFDPTRYTPTAVDANRVLHNEFLRAAYEWGLVGLVLLILLLAVVIRNAFHVYRVHHASRFVVNWLLVAVLPLIVLSFLVENVLAGSGNGWGVGFLSVMVASPHIHRRAASRALSDETRHYGTVVDATNGCGNGEPRQSFLMTS